MGLRRVGVDGVVLLRISDGGIVKRPLGTEGQSRENVYLGMMVREEVTTCEQMSEGSNEITVRA